MKLLAVLIVGLVACAAFADDSAHLTGNSISADTLHLTSVLIDNSKAIDAVLQAGNLSGAISFSRGTVDVYAPGSGTTTTYRLEVRNCSYAIDNYKCAALGTLTVKEIALNNTPMITDPTYQITLDATPLSGTPLLTETIELASVFADQRSSIAQPLRAAGFDRHLSFSVATSTESVTNSIKTTVYTFAVSNCPYSPSNNLCVWGGTLTLQQDETFTPGQPTLTKTYKTPAFKDSGLG